MTELNYWFRTSLKR